LLFKIKLNLIINNKGTAKINLIKKYLR